MMSDQRHSVKDARRLAHAYDELADTMVDSLQGFTSRGGWQYALQLSTIGLTTKAHCTSRAILQLLQHELLGEAQVLLRVLVELAVTALAIGREPKSRALLYLNYRHIAKYKQWEKAAANTDLRKALFEEDPRQAGQLKENYERYKGMYITKKGQARAKWHEGSSAQLSREVGLGDLWDAMYGIDSALVHSGPDCLFLYVRQPRPQQLDVGQLADEKRVTRVLLDVATCMQRVLYHFLDVFPSAERRAQLAHLCRQREKLFSRYPL